MVTMVAATGKSATLQEQQGALAAADARDGEKLLGQLLSPVADDLRALSANLLKFLPVETQTSQQIAQHIFAAGGKRIRPALFFMTARMLGYAGDQLQPMAAVCEYVHTASLLHDDVVDNSSLRRNKPTANSIWGDEASVLVGDLIYARASEMMAATGSLDIVSTFARAIRLMSEGELLQLENTFQSLASKEDYLTIVNNKTAVLIAAACKTAGYLAKLDEPGLMALERLGTGIGMAFQMTDDALDYLADQDLFGKPTLADLPQGKVTLPLIITLERASAAERAMIQTACANPNHITEASMQEIAGLVRQYEGAEAALATAAEFSESAIAALERFPVSRERDELGALVACLTLRWH